MKGSRLRHHLLNMLVMTITKVSPCSSLIRLFNGHWLVAILRPSLWVASAPECGDVRSGF